MIRSAYWDQISPEILIREGQVWKAGIEDWKTDVVLFLFRSSHFLLLRSQKPHNLSLIVCRPRDVYFSANRGSVTPLEISTLIFLSTPLSLLKESSPYEMGSCDSILSFLGDKLSSFPEFPPEVPQPQRDKPSQLRNQIFPHIDTDLKHVVYLTVCFFFSHCYWLIQSC